MPIGHSFPIMSYDCDLLRGRIVTGSNDGTARIWDMKSGKQLSVFEADSLKEISKVKIFIPGEKLIISYTGKANSGFRVFDLKSGILIKQINCYSGSTIEISEDGSKIFFQENFAKYSVIDITTNGILLENKLDSKIKNVKFSTNGNRLIIISEKQKIYRYDFHQAIKADSFLISGGKIKSYTIDNNISFLLAGFAKEKEEEDDNNSYIKQVWDLNTFKKKFDIQATEQTITGDSYGWLGFSPNSRYIWLQPINEDKHTLLIDAKSGKHVFDLKANTDLSNPLQFSSDGRKIVFRTEKELSLLNLDNGKISSLDFLNNEIENPNAVFCPGKENLFVTSKSNSPFSGITGFLKTTKDYKKIEFTPERKSSQTISKIDLLSDGKTALAFEHDNSITVYDLDKNDNSIVPERRLTGKARPVNNIQISPDGSMMISSSGSGSFSVWDIKTGRLLLDTSNIGGLVEEKQGSFGWEKLIFSPDSKKICVINGFFCKIWDIQKKSVLNDYSNIYNQIYDAKFLPNNNSVFLSTNYGLRKLNVGKHSGVDSIFNSHNKELLEDESIRGIEVDESGNILAVAYNSSTYGSFRLKLINITKNQIIKDFKRNEFRYINFEQNASRLLIEQDTAVVIWDIKSGEVVFSLSYIRSQRRPLLNKQGNKLYAFANNSIYCYDTEKWEKVFEINSGFGPFTSCEISSKGDLIIAGCKDEFIRAWDANSGKLLYQIPTQIDKPLVSLNSDGKTFVSTDGSNFGKVWDLYTGKLLYQFFPLSTFNDYLLVDKYNHYDGTPSARKLLYFTCGTEVIELNQLKDQLWVPNLAERIMKGDSINAKTLSELNICGLTPEVEDKSNGEQYRFDIKPRRGSLGETMLYINGIEARRYKPAQLTKNVNGYQLLVAKKDLSAYFIAGKENPVTVKAYTADNSISSRGIIINEDKTSEKETARPSLYAVMVGVSDYKGEKLDLKYAAKDANDIANAISLSAKKLLNTDGKEHVFVYDLTTSEKRFRLPEKNSIKKVLEEIGTKATANDILMIFFAGHGVMAGDKKQFYFLTADASDATGAEAVTDVGISTAELTEWMKPQNIKAQKRILIFDACNSGQAIRDLVKVGNDGQGYIAARSDEQSQQIKAIDKLNEQSGFFILSASASNQSAYEMGRYSQGLLTYSLLKAIKQQPDILEQGKYLDVSRWFSAAEKTVTELTKENGARQQPQIVSNTNFNIGIVDDEVMAKISLPQEKPLFTNSNLQNADENIAYDDKELSKLLDAKLSDISARGSDGPIVYTPNLKTGDVWVLSGRYEIKGNSIVSRINIRQGNAAPKHRFELTGTTDKLNELATAIAEKATSLVK